jgi:23S rRNA (pseudouridine1915-N3)-methyltransferase
VGSRLLFQGLNYKMNIHIITVGSLKETFWKDAVREYAKRLSGYVRLTITELKDEKTPARASAAEEQKIKDTEGKRILAEMKEDSFVVVLEIRGKRYSSEEFAKAVENWEVRSRGNLVFVIGGSLGLSAKVLDRADKKISFSDMTFPHQLMRVILLEQIYRAYRIKNGEPYHK